MRSAFASICVVVLCFGVASAQAPIQRPSIESFVARNPALTSVSLSPSGDYVAYLREVDGAHQLVVLNLETQQGAAIRAVSPSAGQRFLWVDWKGDDRLVFGLRQTTTVTSQEGTGSRLADVGGGSFSRSRVFSVHRDGGGVVEMFGEQSRQLAYGLGSTFLIDELPADDAHILLVATDNAGVGVWRADVATGRVERVANGDFDTFGYVTDGNGYPVMRMDTIQNGAGYRVMRRAPGEGGWTRYIDVRRGARTTNSPDFTPISAGPGAGQVYVLARPEDRDLLGLYLFDTATGQLSAPLQEAREADVTSPVIHPTTRAVFATCEYGQRLTCNSADRSVDRHLRAVQSFVGADVMLSLVDLSADANTWLLYATGPGEPGAYYVYDRAAASMEPLAAVYPQAPVDALSPIEVVSYQSRDGTPLWAYVVARPGNGPRPMVVLPHGGPEVRDHFDYDAYAQFLASRGYVVLQPNFRGSLGFGRRFADAGRGQWGLMMQNDVTDAVQHMIAQNVADPQRICIVGASYGGYVALAGVSLTPELYQCAISISGVSDLPESLRTERRENGRLSSNYQYWLRSIGDPNENRDALYAVSPARLADRITAPVLLIHGSADDNVPFEQSRIMQRALREAGKPTRLIELEDAGHYWDEWSQEHRTTLFAETETFLAQHLGAN